MEHSCKTLFAARLSEAMSLRKASQSDVAEMAGVTKASVSLWIYGRTLAKKETAAKLAAALKVSELWLLGCDIPMREGGRDPRRRANGTGSVSKLPGDRKNPFVARVSAKAADGKGSAQRSIGSFATCDDALDAIQSYIDSHVEAKGGKATFCEVYAQWARDKLPELGESSRKTLKAAYKHCAGLHGMEYSRIRETHMQACVDGCGLGHSTQAAIKILFGHLDRYVSKLGMGWEAFSHYVSVPAPEEPSATDAFADAQVDRIWELACEPWADSVLALMYSGWRTTELLNLKASDVDLALGVMRGGLKTRAGKNRIVPIHSKIRAMVERRCADASGGYVFGDGGMRCPAHKYYDHWRGVMHLAGIEGLTPRSCRVTLRSRMDRAGANKVCIDRIMGHKSRDVGESVYTVKTIDDLREAIEMVTW